jgi:hypothetical protein
VVGQSGTTTVSCVVCPNGPGPQGPEGPPGPAFDDYVYANALNFALPAGVATDVIWTATPIIAGFAPFGGFAFIAADAGLYEFTVSATVHQDAAPGQVTLELNINAATYETLAVDTEAGHKEAVSLCALANLAVGTGFSIRGTATVAAHFDTVILSVHRVT